MFSILIHVHALIRCCARIMKAAETFPFKPDL